MLPGPQVPSHPLALSAGPGTTWHSGGTRLGAAGSAKAAQEGGRSWAESSGGGELGGRTGGLSPGAPSRPSWTRTRDPQVGLLSSPQARGLGPRKPPRGEGARLSPRAGCLPAGEAAEVLAAPPSIWTPPHSLLGWGEERPAQAPPLLLRQVQHPPCTRPLVGPIGLPIQQPWSHTGQPGRGSGTRPGRPPRARVACELVQCCPPLHHATGLPLPRFPSEAARTIGPWVAVGRGPRVLLSWALSSKCQQEDG